jgi:hypothetical protein
MSRPLRALVGVALVAGLFLVGRGLGPAAALAQGTTSGGSCRPGSACSVGSLTSTGSAVVGALTADGGFIHWGLLVDGGIRSSAASGGKAFEVVTSGAAIDYGAGASDQCSSDSTTITCTAPITSTGLVKGGTLATGSSVGVAASSTMLELTAGWGLSDAPGTEAIKASSGTALTAAGSSLACFKNLTTNKACVDLNGAYHFMGNPSLPTCAGPDGGYPGIEGKVSRDVLSGVATGKRTKLCVCTSDGALTYVWQNLATATLGTATTCGTE